LIAKRNKFVKADEDLTCKNYEISYEKIMGINENSQKSKKIKEFIN
jgi:hypothetical protein